MSNEVYELISKLDVGSFVATDGEYDDSSTDHFKLYCSLKDGFTVLLSRPENLSLSGENWLECAFNDSSISDNQFLIFLTVVFDVMHANTNLWHHINCFLDSLESLQQKALSSSRWRVERALSFCRLVMVRQLMESAPGVASVVDVSGEDGVDVEREGEGEGEESKYDESDEDSESVGTKSVLNQKFYRCATCCYFLVDKNESHVISNDEMCYLIDSLKKELVIFLPNVSEHSKDECYRKELELLTASPFIRENTLFETAIHFLAINGSADAKKDYVNFFVATWPHFTDKFRCAFIEFVLGAESAIADLSVDQSLLYALYSEKVEICNVDAIKFLVSLLRREYESTLESYLDASSALSSARSQYEVLREENSELEAENGCLRGEVARLSDQVARLSDQVARLSEAGTSEEGDHVKESRKILSLEQENALLKEKLDAYERKHKRIAADVDYAEASSPFALTLGIIYSLLNDLVAKTGTKADSSHISASSAVMVMSNIVVYVSNYFIQVTANKGGADIADSSESMGAGAGASDDFGITDSSESIDAGSASDVREVSDFSSYLKRELGRSEFFKTSLSVTQRGKVMQSLEKALSPSM